MLEGGDRKLELPATLGLIVDGNDCLDGAEGGIGKFVEFSGNFFDVEAVGDPEVGVDVTGLDDFDDFGEVGGEGVAGGEEGLLAAVEDRGVREGEIKGRDAHIDNASSEAAEFEAGGHRSVRSGGVDDDIGEVAVGHCLELGKVRAVDVELDAVFDAEVFGAKVEAALNHVHDDDLDVRHEFEELKTGESDGSGSDDEDGFTGLRVTAFDSVKADSEGFN